ncbi:FkbM family methyltransferase [Azospirillum doebereinerae]|uniref:FkbM family methyltransferase n=1 Tax=Azospirillum doebereinerae TaxID=92933 RepID=A0A433J6Y1_9PROT|nr:FkbM family methyltransferase [Azospirillum doebereinerae]MCG5238879.1 FkbM family methyltransferase [Azospirillum doebereinerae]RUQ68893.1 FkbM family methyltransferase [Azospirillum doebereinerae]
MKIETDSLDDLRSIAMQAPRRQSGILVFRNFEIEYDDLLSLYMEIKNIFENRIYDFRPVPERSMVIVDGGAHLGLAALRFHSLCPEARIRCFEPDPGICAMLRRNLARNGLASVEVVESGLSDCEGLSRFEADGADGGRMIDASAPPSGSMTIHSERLSAHIAALGGRLDFLKLNIEGMELPVLRELEAVGQLASIDRLVLEYHGWAGGEQRLGPVLDLLDRNGFRYLVHDFDHETNAASKPPFRNAGQTTWFALVYGSRVDAPLGETRT